MREQQVVSQTNPSRVWLAAAAALSSPTPVWQAFRRRDSSRRGRPRTPSPGRLSRPESLPSARFAVFVTRAPQRQRQRYTKVCSCLGELTAGVPLDEPSFAIVQSCGRRGPLVSGHRVARWQLLLAPLDQLVQGGKKFDAHLGSHSELPAQTNRCPGGRQGVSAAAAAIVGQIEESPSRAAGV